MKFEVGDKVFLKIIHLKASLMAGKEKKLQSRFVEPYEVILAHREHGLQVGITLELIQNS